MRWNRKPKWLQKRINTITYKTWVLSFFFNCQNYFITVQGHLHCFTAFEGGWGQRVWSASQLYSMSTRLVQLCWHTGLGICSAVCLPKLTRTLPTAPVAVSPLNVWLTANRERTIGYDVIMVLLDYPPSSIFHKYMDCPHLTDDVDIFLANARCTGTHSYIWHRCAWSLWFYLINTSKILTKWRDILFTQRTTATT